MRHWHWWDFRECVLLIGSLHWPWEGVWFWKENIRQMIISDFRATPSSPAKLVNLWLRRPGWETQGFEGLSQAREQMPNSRMEMPHCCWNFRNCKKNFKWIYLLISMFREKKGILVGHHHYGEVEGPGAGETKRKYTTWQEDQGPWRVPDSTRSRSVFQLLSYYLFSLL